MDKRKRKAISAVVSLTLMFALAIGCFDILGVVKGPSYEVQAISSGGSSDSGSSSSSSSASSSTSSSSTSKKSKKKSKKKKKLSVTGNAVSIAYLQAQSGDTVFTRDTIMTIKNAGGKKTYKLVSASASKDHFKLSKKGHLTVKAGLPTGTYTVKIKVKTKGSSKYRAGTKTASVMVVVDAPIPTPDPAAPVAPAQ